MDKVVQQNAANAEESASASEQMNAQAEQMKGMVGDLMALVAGESNGVAVKKAPCDWIKGGLYEKLSQRVVVRGACPPGVYQHHPRTWRPVWRRAGSKRGWCW